MAASGHGFVAHGSLSDHAGSVKIGPYEVIGPLGQGGAGAVHRARGPSGEEVAIKVLHAVDEPRLARFERERRLLGTFTARDGFVPLLDAGRTAQGPFIVMPIVPGGTLRDRLKRGPLGIEETAALGRTLAAALGRAHAKGIVHRDLKPENVLYTARGEPLVADLGLAKHFDREAPGASQSLDLSKPGTARGTFGYMPLEQIKDAASVGPAADVFAIGAILYECLAGKPAFEGESYARVLDAVSAGKVAPLRKLRPEAPRELVATIERALAPDPGDRPADGRALLAAFESRPRSRSRAAVALTLFLVAGTAALSFLLSRPALGVTIDAPPPGFETPEDELLVTASTQGAPTSAEVVVAGERPTAATLDARGRVEAKVKLPAREGPLVLEVVVHDARGSEKKARVELRRRAWSRGEHVRSLRKAAEGGDGRAMVALGLALWRGQETTRDRDEALSWYTRAAAAGNVDAMFALGAAYDYGVLEDASKAALWYRKAADAGQARAMTNLGNLYADGRGVAKDKAAALDWYRKAAATGDAGMEGLGSAMGALQLGRTLMEMPGVANNEVEARRSFETAATRFRAAAEKGDAHAMNALADMYTDGLIVTGDSAELLRWRRKAADAGDLDALMTLSLMYLHGRGVPRDAAAAVELLKKAADGGDARAMYTLSSLSRTGEGVPRDEVAAGTWLRKAADAGHVSAMAQLGEDLVEGRNGAKDEAEGARWVRKAAERGDPRAMRRLAALLAQGQGEAKNEAEAVAWYEKVAATGDATAMNALGEMLAQGRGRPLDYAAGVRWFREAAAHGNAAGTCNLGIMLQFGLGVTQDEAEAARCYEMAAAMGSADGMYRMAVLLEEGRGVATNRDRAIELYRKAAAQGVPGAREALRRLGVD